MADKLKGKSNPCLCWSCNYRTLHMQQHPNGRVRVECTHCGAAYTLQRQPEDRRGRTTITVHEETEGE